MARSQTTLGHEKPVQPFLQEFVSFSSATTATRINDPLALADRFGDDLNIHRGFPWRAGALAIHAVLSDQYQSVREHIERHGELPRRDFPS